MFFISWFHIIIVRWFYIVTDVVVTVDTQDLSPKLQIDTDRQPVASTVIFNTKCNSNTVEGHRDDEATVEARDDASFFTDCLQVTSASSTLTSNILLTMAQITQQLCLNLSQNHSNKLVIQPLSANMPGQPVTGSTEKPTTHCHHNQAGTHYYLPSHTASPPFGRHQLSYHIFIMPKQRNTLDICTQHKSINT